jgi:ParB family chromosome partitioning protein
MSKEPQDDQQARKTKAPVDIKLVDVKLMSNTRLLHPKKVNLLSASVGLHGLQHAIHVYELENGGFGLAAGRHRFEAVKKLGWTTIPAVILTRAEALVWQWTENNDRYNIDALTESIGIVESARASEKLRGLVSEAPKGGKQPEDKGYSKLAKKTGRDRKRVSEAFLHHALPKLVKEKIYQNSQLNKRRTLTLLGNMSTVNEQLAYIRGNDKAKPASASSQTKKRKPKAPWGMYESCQLRTLKKAYRKCPYKAKFEKQSELIRKRFVKECLQSSG